ncbi:hypothetical protein, partial [Halorubrum sp. SD626R]|uniref:hypothetical protein n=1 Tax=Halorubrum sp. SD626R TaxID=1419722 RepID=UPI001A7E7C7D
TTESANVTLNESDRAAYDSVRVVASTGANASLIDSVNWGTVGSAGGPDGAPVDRVDQGCVRAG